MADTMQYLIGADVRCSDDRLGRLRRVVIDPVARTATHLVVEPTHRVGMARLVPLDLVEGFGPSLRLRCTLAEFGHLDAAEEAPEPPGGADFGYLEMGSLDGFGANATPPIFFDKVPVGEVEVAGGDRVHATDGHVGHVRGLILDSHDRRVTHVLLTEGHLWGRKDVAIPISAVSDLTDGIRLHLSKREVQHLEETHLADRG
jgi:sporulation protein YlmC with PRC-barrel domain